MFLPLAVIALAIIMAGVVAYGCESSLGSIGAHGIDLILWSRRLQSPLVVSAIVLCLVLAFLVISGKRRVWWLLGLLPVLALFTHHFITGPALRFHSLDDPSFVAAQQVTFLADADQIVGITRDGVDYTFPYSVLYHDPVIVQSDRAGAMVIFWSARANRAAAFNAARDLRARDLDIVSSPANTLIVFNSRLGQFINGITGHICGNEDAIPAGIREPLLTQKMSWANWKTRHPQTVVMIPPNDDWKTAPNQPIAPEFPMPASKILPDATRVCLVATTQPMALTSDMVLDQPLNLKSGQSEFLLLRVDGTIRGYNRQLPQDLVPRFNPIVDPKHKFAVLADTDTGSEWSAAGEVVQGPPQMPHVKLATVPVEEDVYLGVMQYWYPDLQMATADEISAAQTMKPRDPTTKPSATKRHKKPKK